MSEDFTFADLIRGVRLGDEGAATQLVRLYEPEIRRVVRARLSDFRLRPVIDSMDICQSVMATFFSRAGIGEFDLDTPDRLRRLLVTMVLNRLRDYGRREQTLRRGRGARAAGAAVLEGVADDGRGPPEV